MRALISLFASGVLLSHCAFASMQTLDGIAAVVNDNIVTQSDLKTQVKLFEKQMARAGAPKVDKAVLEKQVLEHLISNEVQLQVAKKTGIHVEEFALDNALEKMAKDNNMTLGDMRKALAAEGVDFKQYRENFRKQMIISQLHERDLIHHVHVSEQEINQFIQSGATQNELAHEYHLGHILVSLPETPTPEQLAAAEKKAQEVIAALAKGQEFSQVALTYSTSALALKGGDLGWRKLPELPTLFVKIVPQLKVNDVPKPMRSASGLHIIKLIDKRSTDAKHTPVEKTLVRHILIKTNAMISDADAKQKLVQLRQKIAKGEDFGQLAKTHSVDLGSASNGGSLGWITKDVLVPEFSKVMVGLKPNEISEPFKTSFGWHIMQVIERRIESNDQAMMRHKATEMIRQRKFEEKLQAWSRH
jgi:peptidyl-prolyl cis-trans isomerase SurA